MTAPPYDWAQDTAPTVRVDREALKRATQAFFRLCYEMPPGTPGVEDALMSANALLSSGESSI